MAQVNFSISNSKKKSFKLYLLAYFIMLGVAASFLIPNYLFLRNNGEFLSIQQIVKKQLNSMEPAIYGTAIHDDTYFYKLALFKEVNPEIVAIGSSRMLQFSERFFTRSYVTIGGSMSSFEEGMYILDHVISTDKNLKVVLLGLDFWWFNPKNKCARMYHEPARLSLQKLLLPFRWLWQGKISFKQYLSRLIMPANSDLIGVDAATNGSGYLPDGTYFYNYEAGEDSSRKYIGMSKRAAAEGTGRFQPSETMDKESFKTLVRLLDILRSKNIKTAVFLTPVAPSVAKEIDSNPDNFKYVTELRNELRKNNIKCYDFIDPSFLGSTDSEFYDGIHPNSLNCERILNFMYKDMDPVLKSMLDIGRIRNDLEAFDTLK